MTAKTPLQLDVWKGDWGLPSVDLDCLRFMTYIKFSGTEFSLNATSNPFWSPTGKLPVLHLKNRTITSYDELVEYICSRDVNPDQGLSKKQLAETEAYTNLLKEKLYPALQYIWWIDTKNCNNVTKPWYSKAIPFPFNFYYPGNYFNKAQSTINSLCEHLDEEKDIETKVYTDAKKCLTAISTRLGESEFMYGSHPKSIDATLFAYLAPLLKAPFQSTVLQNHLKACTNLHKFVSRINQRYFSKDYHDYEHKRKEELKSQQNKDTEFPNKTRNQLFAILFAAFAMFSYAVHAGIVERPLDMKGYVDEEPYEPQEKFKEEEN